MKEWTPCIQFVRSYMKASPTPYGGEDAMSKASPTLYSGEDATMSEAIIRYAIVVSVK